MDEPAAYEEMRDIWGDYNERQRFEHELIDRKTTWMLVAQGLFFAAYGATFGKTDVEMFRLVVAGSGFSTAWFVFAGVLALIRSKSLSWQDYRRYFGEGRRQEKLPGPIARRPLQWGVDDQNTKFALSPDVLLPLVFVVAWGFLLASPIR
jgi:hypothetical protein